MTRTTTSPLDMFTRTITGRLAILKATLIKSGPTTITSQHLILFTPSDRPKDKILGRKSWEASLKEAIHTWRTTLNNSGILAGCRLMIDVKRDKFKTLGFLRSILKLGQKDACSIQDRSPWLILMANMVLTI
ncbi:hypothetical protein PspLS_09635 [Pyricularia sp. CBS 133598]|nr:hypothetical protein PspLS_09635 [Pyricularia sp. CBS 133598]